MNRFFKRLPLLAKLLAIAIIPILFIIFLTIQVYNEKSRNVAQIKSHLDGIQQSSTITRLTDQLQKERRFSFDYALLKGHHIEMISQRPVTDSFLRVLSVNSDKTLAGFTEYAFLENIDSVRNKIDRGKYSANQVMHFYSSAIFRFSTLNIKTPSYGDKFLTGLHDDLTTQRILSEMITYLGIINANVYNVLYTKQYMVETLLGTLPTYDIYRSYEKELLIKAPTDALKKYKTIRNNSALKPVADYVANLFTNFSFDSTYNYQQWSQISDQALNEMRNLQIGLLTSANDRIRHYYNSELSEKTKAIIYLITTCILLAAVSIYILHIVNTTLNQLKDAALKIANGETGVELPVLSKDAIGSLGSSILKIDEKNKELATAAKKIGAGDFDAFVQPRSAKDLLGNAIVQMKASLRTFTEDLEKSREEFKALADFMPQIVWTARPDGSVDYYNKQWYEITGAKPGVSDQSWISMLHPEDVGACLAAWYKSVESGEPYEIEYRFKDVRSGTYRWFLGRALAIKNENNNIIKWFGTATDIHDQKVENEKLEGMVAERTIELRRSNEDLQQFAHVASHDLKEPIRKIRTFSDRLNTEFGTLMPDNARVYVEKMQTSCERMTNMIDSVLSYSVVNATEQVLETVDLHRVIEGIQNDLELLIIQKAAKIQLLDLPRIKAVPALIYQLFYNLINNALKFSRPGIASQIKISSARLSSDELNGLPDVNRSKHYFKIMIEDNGIGFNPEYAGKLFHVFTRLNSREKYEGTGLGLALCKKIVERHHGSIYATGKEDVGSTFYVVLPDC